MLRIFYSFPEWILDVIKSDSSDKRKQFKQPKSSFIDYRYQHLYVRMQFRNIFSSKNPLSDAILSVQQARTRRLLLREGSSVTCPYFN